MSDLKGKVAIVTGASKGIGAGIARSLGKAGASVVVNYAASRDGADKVVTEIQAAGGKAIAVQGDVANAADVKRIFAVSKETFGLVDILVNNAGIYGFAPIDQVNEQDFHRQFDTNVLGIVLTTREAVAQFNGKGGSVINVSSVVSEKGIPGASVYSATKGAVDALTRALAVELGPRGIRVNTIAPGPVETEGTHANGMVGSDFLNGIVSSTPLGRIGQPDDVAKVAVFLASDDSAWLTGERLSASGGF
ncbi:MAG TPA: glucose 1-dehydrogenase [Hyphomonadaceae bacterium]|nr:glucose 1-dehydrogenase [Hyphomonadaceae bacterium]